MAETRIVKRYANRKLYDTQRSRYVTLEQIADMILESLGKPASLKHHIADRPGQVDTHIGSTDRAAALLGWRSSIPFEDGLNRTIAWYRENPAWWTAVLAGETTAQTV